MPVAHLLSCIVTTRLSPDVVLWATQSPLVVVHWSRRKVPGGEGYACVGLNIPSLPHFAPLQSIELNW